MSDIPNQPPHYNQPPPYQSPGYNPQTPPGGYSQQFPPPNNGYQNYPPPPGGYNPYAYMPQTHPDASSAQTCGIIGLVLFFNIIGIILNIIAIVKGGNVMRDYHAFPGRYTESSFSKGKAGRTCGIVGLSIAGFVIVAAIFIALIVNL
jgi:hypothetical protein